MGAWLEEVLGGVAAVLEGIAEVNVRKIITISVYPPHMHSVSNHVVLLCI